MSSEDNKVTYISAVEMTWLMCQPSKIDGQPVVVNTIAGTKSMAQSTYTLTHPDAKQSIKEMLETMASQGDEWSEKILAVCNF